MWEGKDRRGHKQTVHDLKQDKVNLPNKHYRNENIIHDQWQQEVDQHQDINHKEEGQINQGETIVSIELLVHCYRVLLAVSSTVQIDWTQGGV